MGFFSCLKDKKNTHRAHDGHTMDTSLDYHLLMKVVLE